MNNIKISASSLNQTPMDWSRNIENILTAYRTSAIIGSKFLLLPELCLTGYGCEDWFLSPSLSERALHILTNYIAPETKICETGSSMPVLMVGTPVWASHACFNGIAVIYDGKIRGIVLKKNLCHDGIHYEDRWFKECPVGFEEKLYTKIARTKPTKANEYYEQGEEEYSFPVGDIYFEFDNIRFGFEICEDAWAAERPGRKLAKNHVDIIFNPSASHFSFDKTKIRRNFVIEGSRAFSCTYVYANLLGNESGRIIFDGDTYIASNGNMKSSGERFSFNNINMITSTIDLDDSKQIRARIKSYQPSTSTGIPSLKIIEKNPYDTSSRIEQVIFEEENKYPDWEKNNLKEEEFTRAVSLGLMDYMLKTKSNGFVISLSGGADSTACAVLVKKALEFYEKTLDKNYCSNKYPFYSEKIDISKHLTCVYQPTKNSSIATYNAAKKIAKGLGAKFVSVKIENIVESYKKTFSKSLDWDLNWENDDITLQNIQARTRAPGVWMIANKENKILISTSNRSEAAVGYATMDGDTCGGIAPIAGIDKLFLRNWLRWMEKEMPFLKVVNDLKPTAELRPLSNEQFDEDDLMPYDILNEIEVLIVREKKSVKYIYEILKKKYSNIHKKTLFLYLEKFCNLWTRNQWKRERYAPAFHLDDHNLDPKTGCRFPIISAAFSLEIDELYRSEWELDWGDRQLKGQ